MLPNIYPSYYRPWHSLANVFHTREVVKLLQLPEIEQMYNPETGQVSVDWLEGNYPELARLALEIQDVYKSLTFGDPAMGYFQAQVEKTNKALRWAQEQLQSLGHELVRDIYRPQTALYTLYHDPSLTLEFEGCIHVDHLPIDPRAFSNIKLYDAIAHHTGQSRVTSAVLL